MSSSPEVVLSPYATLGARRADGRCEVELTEALSRARLVVGPAVGRLLMLALEPQPRAELVERMVAETPISPSDAAAMVDALIEAGVLTAPGDREDVWLKRGWRAARVYALLTSDLEYVEDAAAGADEKRRRLLGYVDDSAPPPLWLERGEEVVELPPPGRISAPAGPTMLRRRTERRFEPGLVPSLQEISTLTGLGCQPAAAVRRHASAHAGENPHLLTLSSYTALELSIVCEGVVGLPDGIYHYDMRHHALRRVRAGRHLEALEAVAIGQVLAQVGVAIVITGVLERTMWRYRDSRALRTAFIEAGSLCHRFVLIAEALGWRSFFTPALRDSPAEELLGLRPYEELALYAVGFGKRRGDD